MSFLNMLPTGNKKRLFNSVVDELGKETTSTQSLTDNTDSKRPRIANNCYSTTSLKCAFNDNNNESVIVNGTSHENCMISPLKRPLFIDANVQTDLTLNNCIISPLSRPTTSRKSVISALISPNKTSTTPTRQNPTLTRAKSTVSISNVSNVSVSKKLTSFSSLCSVDLSKADEGPLKQRFKLSETKKLVKRPRLKHTRTAAVDGTDEPSSSFFQMPNKKRCVDFGSVDVYSFEFRQSCDTVPSEGGIPLGMEDKHHDVKHYPSYRDFQRERFAEQKEKYSLDSSIMGYNKRRRRQQHSTDLIDHFPVKHRSSKNEPSTSAGINHTLSSKWTTSDEDAENIKKHTSILMLDKRRRQQIITDNNIQLNQEINDECLRIVQSRLTCGCTCQQGRCLPDSCECAQNGIECLVDKPSFPCSCTSSSCLNPSGRVEFDEAKIKHHYRETMKRLNSNKRREYQAKSMEIFQSPLTHSFEKLELKAPPSPTRNPLQKSKSVGSKITTQFSSTGSISLPFVTPQAVTKRRKRYPVTPTFRYEQDEELGTLIEVPSIIELDSTINIPDMEMNDSVQIIGEVHPAVSPTRSNKQARMTNVEICEVIITSPDVLTTSPQTNVFTTQPSLLSADSRSLSAATSTTEETSRTNSTEDFTSH